MGEFFAKPQILAKVIQAVRVKSKLFPRDLDGIDGFIGGWRVKAMGNEAGADFLDVELVAVVADQYVRFVKQLPEIGAEGFVRVFVLLVTPIIAERPCVDFLLAKPFVGKAENVPRLLVLDYVLLVVAPYPRQIRGGFDVE